MKDPFENVDFARVQQAIDDAPAKIAAQDRENLRALDIMRIRNRLSQRILLNLDGSVQETLIAETPTVDALVDKVVRAKDADPTLTDAAYHAKLVEDAQAEGADPELAKMAEVSGQLLIQPEAPDAQPAYLFDTTIA